MPDIWQDLIGNLGVVALAFAAWIAVQTNILERFSRRRRDVALGVFMGAAALSSMLLAVPLRPGVIFDLRTPLVGVAALFGGPIGAFVAGVPVVLYRIWVGGPGLPPALLALVLVGLSGVVGALVTRRRPGHRCVFALGGVVVAATYLSLLLLPGEILLPALTGFGPPTAIVGFGATIAAGLVILRTRRLAEERHIVASALLQAPDYYYVKDLNSRFIAVNLAVARHHGLDSPDQMIGLTDEALMPQDRARELRKEEQEILRTGIPLLNHEEVVVEEDHTQRWYSTSKVPVRDRDGTVIGLAGVTRDITERRGLESEVRDSRDLLNYAFTEMSDGLAMFDRHGTLIYCNNRYRELFPLTQDVRKPGVKLRSILERVVETGEQVNLGDAPAWVARVVDSLHIEGEEQIQLFDGRWLHLRTRPTASGAALIVVSDVTEIKRNEAELKELTAKLKVEAETDGLTGLRNRRVFDKVLPDAVRDAHRTNTPMSLLMLDVDRFKLYNDLYGHPAGDECLRIVAQCLKVALLRPSDVAARYGGEEFVAILPGTGEDDAFTVAERVREALRQMSVPHRGGLGGLVTVSIGIASAQPASRPVSALQLVSRADKALYDAKGAGRNRVMGWGERAPSRSSLAS